MSCVSGKPQQCLFIYQACVCFHGCKTRAHLTVSERYYFINGETETQKVVTGPGPRSWFVTELELEPCALRHTPFSPVPEWLAVLQAYCVPPGDCHHVVLRQGIWVSGGLGTASSSSSQGAESPPPFPIDVAIGSLALHPPFPHQHFSSCSLLCPKLGSGVVRILLSRRMQGHLGCCGEGLTRGEGHLPSLCVSLLELSAESEDMLGE